VVVTRVDLGERLQRGHARDDRREAIVEHADGALASPHRREHGVQRSAVAWVVPGADLGVDGGGVQQVVWRRLGRRLLRRVGEARRRGDCKAADLDTGQGRRRLGARVGDQRDAVAISGERHRQVGHGAREATACIRRDLATGETEVQPARTAATSPSPAALRSASALSVRSHVKSWSSRPK
jgi:hypothetical protein